MSKEYLEAFGRITLHTEYDNDGSYDCLQFEDDCKLVDEALERLESIDNANPSEALKELELVENWIRDRELKSSKVIEPSLVIIEQALLKAQEPKQYLKWEDLEFNHKPVFTEAKMGKTIYKLVIGFDCTGKETIFLRTDNQQIVFHEKDIQFFNDLRLERVEE